MTKNPTTPNEEVMKTLALIDEGYYNVDRPSNLIIKELVDVIKYLNEKINSKQNKM